MRKVKVKICGITNWADAKRASAVGADFLGFNFYPLSPRYIAPTKAQRIVRRLPQRMSAVGVFVNETEEKTLEIARAVGLDYLQLHGDESPEAARRLQRSFPVIKAVRVRDSFRPAQLARFRHCAAILLDGFHHRSRGGTGKVFRWDVVKRARKHGRIFLAGGLTPDNIAEAICTAQPYAVDVCSGVEAMPGKKDAARLAALMRAARGAGKRKLKTRSAKRSRRRKR
jgi:phosphoribosylanthranilate isomerase